jgi:hypothetical protein
MPTRFSLRVSDHRVLRVGAELGPERAAHIRGDDPQGGLVDAEHAGQRGAGALGALVRDPRGEPAVLAPGRGRGPGLHRRGRDPLVDDGAGDDHLAPVEQVRGQRGTVTERGGDVGARRREQHRRPLVRGGGHVDDRRQHVVVHVHQVPGVLALVAPLGDYHGHRLADVPDHAGGQQRLAHLRVDHARHGRGRHRHVGQVSPGEHGDDPGRFERGADVDGGDPRVRDGRTDEVDVARAGQAHVLGIDPAGGQEAGIFGPDDPGAQYAHDHDLAWAGRRRSKRASAPRGREDRVPWLR